MPEYILEPVGSAGSALTKILNERAKLPGYTEHLRPDFTYIDDVVAGILNILPNPPIPNENGDRYKVYNIGNNKPEKIMDYFVALEKALGMTAKKEFLPMQLGDVYQTYADVDDLIRDFDFKSSIPIEVGLEKFVDWYRKYYGV